MGLNLDVDNRYYSSDVAAGHILSQSPPPGTVVRREWRVRIAESLGPQKVDVPDTVGTEGRVAALRLRRVGLEVGVTAKLPYGAAPDGAVLAQDPPAHAQGIAQPSVNLLVAAPDDAAPDGYVMPDMQIDTAQPRQSKHPRRNDATVCHDDNRIRLNGLQLRAKFLIVADLIRLRYRQTRCQSGLLHRCRCYLVRPAYRSIRLRDHQRYLVTCRKQSFQGGHGKARSSAKNELHRFTKCLRAASCESFAGSNRA